MLPIPVLFYFLNNCCFRVLRCATKAYVAASSEARPLALDISDDRFDGINQLRVV